MGPKKSVSPKKEPLMPKAGKDSPKSPKRQVPAFDDPIEIRLRLLEVHNILEGKTDNILVVDVSFMERGLDGEGDITFKDCICRHESNPISTWTLRIKENDEQTLMDISSHPLLVSISETGRPVASAASFDVNMEIASGNSPQSTTYCCVDMIDLVSAEITTINSRAYLYPAETPEGPDIITLPKRAYIKYSLTSSKPILSKKFAQEVQEGAALNTLTIATEFIMHPPPEIFVDNVDFEVNLNLPLRDGLTKPLKFQQGHRCKFSELPSYKTRFGLSSLPGEAKFSREPVACELAFEDLEMTDGCHLPSNLLRNYSQLISLNEVYRCKQLNSVVKNIVQARELPVEVICKKPPIELRFTGVINVGTFSYVNQISSRQAIPLKPVSLQNVERKGSTKRPTSAKEPKTAQVVKEKTKRGKSKVVEKVVVIQNLDVDSEETAKSPFATCEDGYTFCLIVNITLDRPLIPLKDKVLCQDEIELADAQVFNETSIKMLDKEELNCIFESQVLKLATHPDLKMYHKSKHREMYPMNDIWSIAENDFFGSSALLIANKYNFNKPMEDDELEVLLRNSYIYMINKAYAVLSEKNDSEGYLEELIKFRLQCAEECRELGYKSAKDFHIMNMKDTGCSPRTLIDYAVFNLRTGDEAMALECVLDALAKDPAFYDGYLLQAYVYYTKRDKKACESTLQYVTKACPNYLEAWIALYLIHADDADKAEIEFITHSIETAFKFPYIGYLHKIDSIFWPPESSSELLVRGMSNFITWGCLQFAEVAVGLSIHKLGAHHYHYLIHQAVIHYVRGRYLDALHTLKEINTNCSCKLVKIKRFTALCYLIIKYNGVMTLMDVLAANFYENKSYTPHCNLINLRLAKYFLETGKLRDGRYYLKKCCKKSGSYASLIELGNSSVKARSYDIAIKCFKLAHKINPFDWLPHAQLAIAYFRSGLVDQYRICSRKAREHKITEEIISRELDKIDETISE